MATTIFLVNPQTFPSSTSYLLDTYSAAAAYSLRQLKTGVTNVVRVRRSSDNAESDFTADEITDGTLTTWTGANDGFVVTWYDQSGNAVDATQSTAGSQPQIVSSGSVITKGSLPAVDFVSSDRMQTSTTSIMDDASLPISIFSVSSADSTETVGAIVSGNNTQFRQFCDSRTTPNRNIGVNTVYANMSTARVDTNQRLLSGFIDASYNMSSFDNGATGGTATAGTWASSALELGAQGSSTYLNGKIQEVIVFNSDESSNRTAIESDINTYYSIY
jgi:hypothetical protein